MSVEYVLSFAKYFIYYVCNWFTESDTLSLRRSHQRQLLNITSNVY